MAEQLEKEKLRADSVNADGKSADDFKEEIQKLMQSMNQAAENMDIEALDQIWIQLSEYQFGEDKQELLDKIHKAIVEFDVDFLQGVDPKSI